MSTCVCLAHSAFQGDPDFGIVSGEHKRRRQFSKGGGANLGARNYEYRRRKVFPCVFCKKGWDRNSLFNCWVHKKCGGVRGTLKEGSSFKCQRCANQQRGIVEGCSGKELTSLLNLWKMFIILMMQKGLGDVIDCVIARVRSGWSKLRFSTLTNH